MGMGLCPTRASRAREPRYYLHTLKFTHLWHKGLLPDIFRDAFHYARMSNRSLFQKNQTLSTVRAIFAETKHYLILPKLTLF